MNARIRFGNSAHAGDGSTSIQNCGQTAADRDMITIDNQYELVIALSISNIADPYNVRFSHNACVADRRQSDDTSYPRLDLTVGQK